MPLSPQSVLEHFITSRLLRHSKSFHARGGGGGVSSEDFEMISAVMGRGVGHR